MPGGNFAAPPGWRAPWARQQKTSAAGRSMQARTERRHCHERDTAAPAARAAPAGKAQPGLGPGPARMAAHCAVRFAAVRGGNARRAAAFGGAGGKPPFACPCLPWLAGRAAVPFVRCECAVRAPALGLPGLWAGAARAACNHLAYPCVCSPMPGLRLRAGGPPRKQRCARGCAGARAGACLAPCGRRGLAYGGIWPCGRAAFRAACAAGSCGRRGRGCAEHGDFCAGHCCGHAGAPPPAPGGRRARRDGVRGESPPCAWPYFYFAGAGGRRSAPCALPWQTAGCPRFSWWAP